MLGEPRLMGQTGARDSYDSNYADIVKLGESFGLPAFRCESPDDFPRHLNHALTLDEPSLVVLPIDYSIDVAVSEELGTETHAQ